LEIGETVRAAVPALAMPHATGLYQAVTVSVGVASQQTERRPAAGRPDRGRRRRALCRQASRLHAVAEHGFVRMTDGAGTVALAS
jgi:hypothetical protein